jgi:hypothetical protein
MGKTERVFNFVFRTVADHSPEARRSLPPATILDVFRIIHPR